MGFQRRSIPGGAWYKLYDGMLPVGLLAARLVALFRPKVKKAIAGQCRGIQGWSIGQDDDRPVILIHIASVGELEGVLPLIGKLSEIGKYRLALSFSSPSVENAAGKTRGIWAYGYMPFDTLDLQIRLMDRLQPALALVSKHDFWPNMIRASAVFNVPFVLINANFHARSKRFLPVIRSFNRQIMRPIKAVWTVSEQDSRRIEPLLTRGTELAAMGDTRYDRVRQRAEAGAEKFKTLKEALGTGPVIVAGSTWLPGERICWRAFAGLKTDYPSAKMVIAPHEPTDEALEHNRRFAGEFKMNVKLLSEWNGGDIAEDTLLVDKMGVLAGLYAVGWAAYVGGGFGKGVHSVIEPAANALPVVFGPQHHVSHEASLLIESGGGFVVKSADELEKLWREWLKYPESYRNAAEAADGVVTSREGVTDILLDKLAPFLG